MNKGKGEVAYFGEIDFSNCLNEAEYGRLGVSSLGVCKVFINDGEGPLAHFHIETLDKDFQACICIYTPNYFDHGRYRDTFNTAQRKDLNKWLSEYNNGEKITWWEAIEMMWYIMNPDQNYAKTRPTPDKRIQPDYTQLKSFRSK